jgi:hypothetical protein
MTTTTSLTQPTPSTTTWRFTKPHLGGVLLLVGVLLGAPASTAAQSQMPVDDPMPDPGASSTVLAGQVLIGPICPVVRLDRVDQCADQPYPGDLSIRTPAGDQEVTQITADAQGSFAVDLAPGTYQVIPLSPPGHILPRGVPQTVTLEDGLTTTIEVHYDSGIR